MRQNIDETLVSSQKGYITNVLSQIFLEFKPKLKVCKKKSGTLLYKVRPLFKGGNYSREETIK